MNSSHSAAERIASRLRKRATVEGRCGRFGRFRVAQQGLLIDFVPAEQIGVVAEIAQEPAEFPQCLWV